MQIDAFAEPRRFSVGVTKLQLSHVANITLHPDEMITFISDGGREYDVTAKDWGYYATPSVVGRLRHFGMRAALMRNVDTGQLFVVLVFDNQLPAWRAYMEEERQELVMWLDDAEAVFENTDTIDE